MWPRIRALATSFLFGAALAALALSVYALAYSCIQGGRVKFAISREDHKLPAPMSDYEVAAYREAVLQVQSAVILPALYVITASWTVILILVVWRIFDRTLRDVGLRLRIVRRIVLWSTVIILVSVGAFAFNRHFASRLPDPSKFVLTRYQPLVAPIRPGLSHYEQYLLEPDPDGDTLTPDTGEIADETARLQRDPDGLTDSTAPLLAPTVVLKSRVAAADLFLGSNGKTVYLLNVLAGKLHALDLQSRRFIAQAELSPTLRSMCFSADGELIYVAAIDSVSVFRSKDLLVMDNIALDFTPSDVACSKSGRLIISGFRESPDFSADEEGLFVLDPQKKSLLGQIDLRDRRNGSLSYFPEDDLLWISPFRGGDHLGPFRVESTIARLDPNRPIFPNWVSLNGKQGDAALDWWNPITWKTYGPFHLSPDARYALFLGRTQLEHQGTAEDGTAINLKEGVKPVAKVPAHHAVAWDLDRRIVLIAFPAGGDGEYNRHRGVIGRLSIYSLPGWTELKTFQLPRPAYQLVWDSAQRQLIAALDEDKDVETLGFKAGLGLPWLVAADGPPNDNLQRLRWENRVTGRNQGPLCLFDLSAEIE